MAIFDYDKKGIEAFNSCCKNDKEVKKPGNGLDFFQMEAGNFSVVTLPLNKEDYPTECNHGYHPIEFLFKKGDLLKFDLSSIAENNKIQSIQGTYFKMPETKNVEV